MSAPTPAGQPLPPSRPNLPGRKTPHYQGGQWSEGTSWLADALDATGESGWEQGLRKLGYSESITAGTEYGFRVELYDRSSQDPAWPRTWWWSQMATVSRKCRRPRSGTPWT